MKQKITILLFLILFIDLSYSQTINSVTTTESRCPSSGTITVNASGGTPPLAYAITAGPVTRSAQNSNVFGNLPPGTYTVQVTGPATVTQSGIVVAGTYLTMNLNANVRNETCPVLNDGRIVAVVSAGRLPYLYELRNSAGTTVIRTQQSNDTFYNVSPGTYQLRSYDSCLNFQSRSVTVGSLTLINLLIAERYITRISCTQLRIRHRVGGHIITPIRRRFAYNGTDTIQLNQNPMKGAPAFDTFVVTSNTGNWFFFIEDACGRTLNTEIPTYVPMVNSGSDVSTGCRKITISSLAGPQSIPNGNWGMVDSVGTSNFYRVLWAGGTIQEVIPYNYNNGTLYNPAASGNYTVRYVNATCNDSHSRVINVISPTFSLNKSTKVGCYDSVGTINVSVQAFGTPLFIVIENGPASFNHPDMGNISYSYPDTLRGNFSNTTYRLSNLPPGTYDIKVYDSCGNTSSTQSITLNSTTDLFYYRPIITVIPGCPGANKVRVRFNMPLAFDQYTVGSSQSIFQAGTTFPLLWSSNAAPLDTFTLSNLNSLTYIHRATGPSLQNVDAAGFGVFRDMSTGGCSANFLDTFIVPSYQSPLITNVGGSLCQNSLNPGFGLAEVFIDSTKGVAPYSYEITSGPQLRALKSTDTFLNIPQGIYNFQLVDACSNSHSFSKEIKPFNMDPVANATVCNNDTIEELTLTSTYGPLTRTTWTHPNGTDSVNTNIFIIDNFSATDTGDYLLKVKSIGFTCIDTNGVVNIPSVLCSLVPLPINFLNATITNLKNKTARLDWTIESDQKIVKYYIYRKLANENEFKRIGEVRPDLFNNLFEFSFYDNIESLTSGLILYGIEAVDLFNEVKNSPILVLNKLNGIGSDNNLINIKPNPSNEFINIEVSSDIYEGIIKIIDLNGKIVFEKSINNSLINVNTSEWISGIYTVQLVTNYGVETHKLVIFK